MNPGSTAAAGRAPSWTGLVFEPVAPGDDEPGTISARRFHRCLLALERAEAVSVPLPFLLSGAVCAPGPAPGVLISFDEARDTVLTVASDILVKSGHSAVVFVATDQIGAPGYLSADQIRVLLGMGVVVGSRGCAGEGLRELPLPALRRELGASRQALRALVGYEVRLLALPRGRADARVLEEARRAGYTVVFGAGVRRRLRSGGVRSRYPVGGDVRPSALEALVRGGRRSALRAYLRGAARDVENALEGADPVARLRDLFPGT